ALTPLERCTRFGSGKCADSGLMMSRDIHDNAPRMVLVALSVGLSLTSRHHRPPLVVPGRFTFTKMLFGESALSSPLMVAGGFEGDKSMTKRRNGESRPETGAGQGPGEATDGHERDKDFLNANCGKRNVRSAQCTGGTGLVKRRGFRSLLERLDALEHGDPGFTPTVSIETEHTRSPMDYFSLGFASACIAGGVAALMLLAVHTADARKKQVVPLQLAE